MKERSGLKQKTNKQTNKKKERKTFLLNKKERKKEKEFIFTNRMMKESRMFKRSYK